MRALRGELDSAPLDEKTRNAAHAALDEVDRGVASGGERRSLGAGVRAVKSVLTDASGAITASGTL